MEIKYTNFDGDWNAPCEYCGKSNLSHQVSAGAHDGVEYVHHQPCDEQLQHSKQCSPPRGWVPQMLQRMRIRRVMRVQKPAPQHQDRIA